MCQRTLTTKMYCSRLYCWLQKKTGNKNFHNVNLVLSICLLDNTSNIFSMSLNFDHNSNLSLVRRFHTMKKLSNVSILFIQFPVFVCNQLYMLQI
jgi:hypothetical protein